ncbi:hypothetical protein GGI07_000869 [Coemansia sp. Benny D115]|nr:hypothetical protein GGI07_000869 [Coemansia sp. Benny D115]
MTLVIGTSNTSENSEQQQQQQQGKTGDSMGAFFCDTPVYDDFVRHFVSEHAQSDRPTVRLARRFNDTWPMAQRARTHDEPMPREVRVGVLDSSFNPPHYCHGAYMEGMGVMEFVSASDARQRQERRRLDIGAYLMLLGSQNADKKLSGATLEQRMRMSREQFTRTRLHNMAIGMVNTPRFVDKCLAVQAAVLEHWPHEAEAPKVLCYFAMGWDTLIRFFDPKYYKDYAAEIAGFFDGGGRIVYSRRTGFPDDDVDRFFGRPDIQPYLPHLFELTLPKRVRHISSTDVRLAVRDSTQSVRDIPPRILEFVNSSQLYRDDSPGTGGGT